jgi:hypothetical protein
MNTTSQTFGDLVCRAIAAITDKHTPSAAQIPAKRLAEVTGCDVSTVYAWSAGKCHPHVGIILAILQAFPNDPRLAPLVGVLDPLMGVDVVREYPYTVTGDPSRCAAGIARVALDLIDHCREMQQPLAPASTSEDSPDRQRQHEIVVAQFASLAVTDVGRLITFSRALGRALAHRQSSIAAAVAERKRTTGPRRKAHPLPAPAAA